MEPNESLNISVEKGQRLEIVSRSNSYKYPPFYMAGSGKRNKSGSSLNLIQILCNLTKSEQFTFSLLETNLAYWETHICKGNICIVRNNELTDSEQQSFKRGYKLLNQKDLVRRIRREHYLISPYLILPKDFEEAVAEWETINQTNTN